MMDTILKNVNEDEIWNANDFHSDVLVGDAFRCAEELFYSDDRLLKHSSEKFVFGGCGGNNVASCPLSSYKFPVEIDANFEHKVVYGDWLQIQSDGLQKMWCEFDSLDCLSAVACVTYLTTSSKMLNVVLLTQVNGVRGSGLAGVHTGNQLDGGYEQKQARRNYNWIIRSYPDINRYKKDRNAGDCVTYGSKVWLQSAARDGRYRK